MNEYIKNLNRIEFVVTMACAGRCKHCSEGDHSSCTGYIDADIAVNAIRDICKNYKIESLMTFGGEPLLYPEVVCKIHKTAIRRIENGERYVTDIELKAFSEIFSVSFDFLLK